MGKFKAGQRVRMTPKWAAMFPLAVRRKNDRGTFVRYVPNGVNKGRLIVHRDGVKTSVQARWHHSAWMPERG